ncbi:MAG TPA: hypothetical protein GXX29_09950 [Firmicutes bacterium]|nr:hypothetical protein [Bacillota bacterium]
MRVASTRSFIASLGRQYWPVGLSAGLLILSYPPVNLFWLSYVAFLPFLYLIFTRLGEKRPPSLGAFLLPAAGLAFLWVLGVGHFTLYIATASPVERLGAFLAFWGVFTAELALFSLLAVLFRHRLEPINWYLPLYLAGFWLLSEWLIAKVAFGLCSYLGVTQWRLPGALALARWTGIHGVSAAVFLLNALLFTLLKAKGAKRRGAAALFLAISLLVATGLSAPPAQEARGGVLLVMVQPGFALEEYLATYTDTGKQVQMFEALLAQSAAGLEEAGRRLSASPGDQAPEPEVIVAWPETVLHEPILQDYYYLERLRQWQAERRTWMLLGLPWYDYDSEKYYNAIALYDPQSRLTGLYYKVKPIPVAESWAAAGRSFAPLEVAGMSLGVGLCSELIDPLPAMAMTAAGAQALIFLSSLDHLPGRTAPALHAAFAPFRAAESGRSVALLGSTGITMMVAPDGTVGPTLTTRGEGLIVAFLPPATGKTPYMAGGRHLPLLALLALTAAFIFGRRKVGILGRRTLMD